MIFGTLDAKVWRVQDDPEAGTGFEMTISDGGKAVRDVVNHCVVRFICIEFCAVFTLLLLDGTRNKERLFYFRWAVVIGAFF